MTPTKDAKEAMEFFINPEIGDIRFQEPDRFKSTYIKVREVMPESPCENCKLLEDELKEFKYAVNRWKAEENGWYDQVALLDNENQKLKSELEMCKETLEFYANKTSYT